MLMALPRITNDAVIETYARRAIYRLYWYYLWYVLTEEVNVPWSGTYGALFAAIYMSIRSSYRFKGQMVVQ